MSEGRLSQLDVGKRKMSFDIAADVWPYGYGYYTVNYCLHPEKENMVYVRLPGIYTHMHNIG
jgi:hypothetical protein